MLRATCEAYTANTPYIAWRELLRELLHIGWQDTDDAVGARLRDELLALAPDLLPWLPLLAPRFDADLPPTPEMALLAEEGQREKLHESVLRFLEVELPAPSAIEIEDAHHMDDASADLLGVPHDASRGPPVAPVGQPSAERRGLRAARGAGRPPDRARAAQRGRGAGDGRRSATEDRPLADHVLRLVVERSGGNPQFLHDLVDAVVESGGRRDADSVEAAAMARVDALSPDDRALVRRAAVFGVMFDPRMLAWVLDDERVPGPRHGSGWPSTSRTRATGTCASDGR